MILLALSGILPVRGLAAIQAPQPESHLEVYLITIGPGDAAASRFGHSVLRIVDHEEGTDLAHSFGQSDPSDLGQIIRLIQGTAEIGVGALPTEELLDGYREQGRTIWSQTLAMAHEDRLELKALLTRAHGTFRYDFFLENCTTRLRDALDIVLDRALSGATAGVPAEATWRDHTDRYTGSSVFLHLLVNFVMGGAADQPIDRWDEMFTPSLLREGLREVTLVGASGESVPLVSGEESWAGDDEEVRMALPAHSLWHLYLPMGVFLGIAIAAMGEMAGSNRGAEALFRVLGGGWLVIVGLAGTALASLWAFSGQWIAVGNENLFQANPLALLLAAAAWGGSSRRREAAPQLALVLAVLSISGVVLKLLPGFDQENVVILALAVPVNLGVAWGLMRRPRRSVQ